MQELPKRKQVVTQERSKVIRETENPFGDDEDEQPSPSQAQASSSRSPQQPNTTTPITGQVSSFSYVASSRSKKKDKEKEKKSSRKHRKFDLEAEKDQMKVTIAESSIAATNLNNALQSINRERERISENALAVAHFETCKQLRRKIWRYVSLILSGLSWSDVAG